MCCYFFHSRLAAVANATGYQLDVATDAAFANFVTGYNNRPLGNVTSDAVTGLLPGTIYYVRLRGFNSCGVSGNSVVLAVSAPVKTWNAGWKQSGVASAPPTAAEIIVFAADYTLSGNLDGCSCEVNSGIKVTISSGNTLSIINGLTVETAAGTSLTFEDTASLWQEDDAAVNKGKITYKRQSSFMKLSDYTYWSSPVKGQNTRVLSPNTETGKFYSFVNNNWKPAYNVTMEPG